MVRSEFVYDLGGDEVRRAGVEAVDTAYMYCSPRANREHAQHVLHRAR